MNVEEVASYTNLSKKTIYNLVYSKKIPFERISEKKVIFHKDEIDKWLHKRNSDHKLKEKKKKEEVLRTEYQKTKELSYRKKGITKGIIKDLYVSFKLNYKFYLFVIILFSSLAWIGSSFYYKFKIFSSNSTEIPKNRMNDRTLNIEDLVKEGKLSGLSINGPFQEKDKVNIKLDYISNLEFEGDVNSYPIKILLIRVLKNEKENYAIKSKTIDIIRPFVADQKIRKSLIYALKNDNNPAIRMKAASVLTKVAKLDEVKEAMLDRIINDMNEVIRFKALEILEDIVDKQIIAILQVLKEKEKSKIVRNRAELILKKFNRKT